MTRPAVRCGTESGYTTHRQRGEDACDPCRTAHREYHREYRRKNRIPRLVDATRTRDHLAALVAEGSTLTAISQRTGISHTTLKDITKGRPVIQAHTANLVLACRVSYGERIPAAGTARRIRALNAIGWSNAHLGARLGVTRDRVAQYANAERVERPTAAKVARVYDELSMTPGPSVKARTWARKRGYMPPLAWDDETIDDPAAWAAPGEPDDCGIDDVAVDRLIAGRATWHDLTRDERIEAARRMDRRGISRTQIADRTGLRSETLYGEVFGQAAS